MAIMLNDENYLQTVNQIKQEIAFARYKAAVQVNQTMVMLSLISETRLELMFVSSDIMRLFPCFSR